MIFLEKVKYPKTDFKLASHFPRTCVDETLLCEGMRLCSNGNDLKWCKNAKSISIHPGWKPLPNLVNCNYINSDKPGPDGQWIKQEEKEDGNAFNCYNRKDENPFVKTENKTEQKKDTWLEDVKEPCEKSWERRCLGNRPDRCIRKFLLNLLKPATVVPLCISKDH